ncbi:MAG: DUF342 domain-containing protein [Chitinivibrionales bacterium]|nr:DUF342 domain-containing protein [Chitinivibrionales bacterium]
MRTIRPKQTQSAQKKTQTAENQKKTPEEEGVQQKDTTVELNQSVNSDFDSKQAEKKSEKSAVSMNQDADADRLLDLLEENILSIEAEEILKGFNLDDIDRKSVSQEIVKINRSKYSEVKSDSEFIFSADVEYVSINLYTAIEEVPFDEFEFLKDVEPNCCIARKNFDDHPNEENPSDPLEPYTSEYQQKANVTVKADLNCLYFISRIAGKVILFNGAIYVKSGDLDATAEIIISADMMKAEVRLMASRGKGKPLTSGLVLQAMRDKKIVFGIDMKAIEEHVESLQSSKKTSLIFIGARGAEPVRGEDAKVTMHFSEDTVSEDFQISPDGRVNYRKKANIAIVHVGDVLAEVSDIGQGTNGMDVVGNTIKALPGDSKVLYAGDNVLVSPDGKKFIANIDGKPQLINNILHVYQNYLVPGDVDFNCGNITFEGNITIQGSILAGFEVKASGDVIVMGNCSGGSIESGRDIRVLGGIIGGTPSARILCGRNCFATYVQNGHLEVQGDLTIIKSCIQSKVFSTGSVFLRETKGAIIGGTTCALNSILVSDIGSNLGTKTELIVGHDFLIKKLQQQYIEAKEFCTVNIQKIEQVLKPLRNFIVKHTEISDQQKQRIALVIKKHRELKKRLELIDVKLKIIDKASKSNAKAVIKVRETAHADVKITIMDNTIILNRDYKYCTFFLNSKTGFVDSGAY